MWRIEFDVRAAKELRKLSADTRGRILSFFKERISTDEDPRRFGKALTANLSGLWRYRIGDYRVICDIEDDKLLVLAVRVGHRRNVY